MSAERTSSKPLLIIHLQLLWDQGISKQSEIVAMPCRNCTNEEQVQVKGDELVRFTVLTQLVGYLLSS